MVLKSRFNEDGIVRDGEQRSFAYFSSDWKYRWLYKLNYYLSSDRNYFHLMEMVIDYFADLQGILHQQIIFWIEIGWVIGGRGNLGNARKKTFFSAGYVSL